MSIKSNNTQYNSDFREMIVDLYRSGQSVQVLSNEYGVSDVTIYQRNKKLTSIEIDKILPSIIR